MFYVLRFMFWVDHAVRFAMRSVSDRKKTRKKTGRQEGTFASNFQQCIYLFFVFTNR